MMRGENWKWKKDGRQDQRSDGTHLCPPTSADQQSSRAAVQEVVEMYPSLYTLSEMYAEFETQDNRT